MAEDALMKAMAPALPKLNITSLQDALSTAKASLSIEPGVIMRAEKKLEQAMKRQASLESG
eukprot:481922-Prymnesium_polylepis.1